MSEKTSKEVPAYVVGLISAFGLFVGPFLGTLKDVIPVLVGWGFGIAFVVMMWKQTKNPLIRVGLIILLIVAIGISASLSGAQSN